MRNNKAHWESGGARTPRTELSKGIIPGCLGILVVALALSCNHNWDAYEPLGTGGQGGGEPILDTEAGNEGAGGRAHPEVCAPSTAESCYEGPTETDNTGICRPGLKACNEDGTGFTQCFGQITPAVEDCGTLQDDDCNGAMNDHCSVWSRAFGGLEDQRALAIAVGDGRSSVVVGTLKGSASFGGATLESAGSGDVFVTELDSSGKHLWSRRFGDARNQEGRAVAVDSVGNVLIAGTFEGSIDFSANLDGKLTTQGQSDVFLVKLSASGETLWSRSFGGKSMQDVRSLAVDGAGSAILAGDFTGSMEIGKGAALSSAGLRDGFAVKIDPDGNVVWRQSFGDTDDDSVQGAAADKAGNVYLTGFFRESVSFGEVHHAAIGGQDVFIAKLDPSGQPLWSRSFGAALNQRGSAIAVDAAGDVAVLGAFDGSIDFDGEPLKSAGPDDIFALKLDASGTPRWSKRLGGVGNEEPSGLAMNEGGDVLLLTSLEASADFGVGLLTSAGHRDVVTVKLASATGAPLWSRRFGDFADQIGHAIAMTATGSALIAGELAGTINFGSGELKSAGDADVFVAELLP